MIRTRPTFLFLLALGAAVPAAARAQSQDEIRASAAVTATPVGAFAPLVATPDPSPLGAGIVGDYGVVSRLGLQSSIFGLSAESPVGRSVRVGVAVGHATPRCTPNLTAFCMRVRMAGLRAQGWLLRRAIGPRDRNGDAAYLAGVGVEAAAGLGSWRRVSFDAQSVGLPIAVAFNVRAPNWSSETDARFRPRTVVFVTPSLMRGGWHDSGLTSTHVFQSLTAGVSVLDIGPGFGVTASARRVAVAHSDLQLDFGLSWHRAR